jgi:hypothetical protein
MAPKEYKISKQAVAATSAITLTIPETFEIIRRVGSATSQSDIMAAQKIRLLTIYGINTQKKLPVIT